MEPILQQSGFMAPESEGETFQLIIRLLKRRGWLLVVGVTLGLLFGIAANLLLHKKYTATATIEIVPDISSQFRVMQVQDIGGGDSDLSGKLDTEIAVLQSRSLALETIRALKLDRNADFLAYKDGQPWDMSQATVRDELVGAFEGDLSVSRVGHTAILAIGFKSSKPALSSLAANALIDNYIEHSFRDNYLATAKVSTWLNSQLNGLKDRLEKRPITHGGFPAGSGNCGAGSTEQHRGCQPGRAQQTACRRSG